MKERKILADAICALINYFNKMYGKYESFTYIRNFFGEEKN